MTNRCFSSNQLYALRNEISVQLLIEKTLHIPCRVTKGCFRFLCPLCSGFDTAVNPTTNLARCFRCETNFNTIDLVMLCRRTKFVDSVRFLQSIPHKKTVCNDDPIQRETSQRNSGPCQIGQIFADIMPAENADSPAESNPDSPITPHRTTDENRMEKLELQFELLKRQIQELSRTISAALPTK